MAINNETEQGNLNLHEWVVAFRRRAGLMARVFAGLIVVVLAFAFLWPATYQASGTILIEQQELPTELVRSTISSYADQRIQIITQQVMTTENLFRIIKKYDLYATARKKRSREYVLEKMKNDVGFQMISADVIDPRSGSPTKATIAFSVSYKNRSADLAARVANELVSLYLQQNIDSRLQRTADATSFLNDEAGRLNKDISAQQATLETFKQKHINDLPEQAQTNVQLLTRTDDELRDIDTRIRSLDQQLVFLDAQLVQISPTSQVYTSTGERVLSPSDRLKFLRTELARVTGLYAPNHPDVLRMRREIGGLEASTGESVSITDLQRQLTAARTSLASLQEKFSADHPDVINLQRSIHSLEEQLVQAGNLAATPDPALLKPDNPAFIQIKAQRQATTAERASLVDKRETVKALAADYAARMSNGPAVEREYSTMLRDLENNQLKYREVRQKQLEAEVAQNLETERKGERFTLIDPPLTPTEPASPNRIVIIVLGLFLSIGIAVAMVVLLEMTDGSVRNRRDLETLLSMPPLAVLPWIDTEADRQLRATRRRYAMVGATVSVVLASTLVHMFYRPLDVLWQVALRRLTG
jgi:succinoglycan biosynthesis transport protein ExoP